MPYEVFEEIPPIPGIFHFPVGNWITSVESPGPLYFRTRRYLRNA